jgi:hypothetical protein
VESSDEVSRDNHRGRLRYPEERRQDFCNACRGELVLRQSQFELDRYSLGIPNEANPELSSAVCSPTSPAVEDAEKVPLNAVSERPSTVQNIVAKPEKNQYPRRLEKLAQPSGSGLAIRRRGAKRGAWPATTGPSVRRKSSRKPHIADGSPDWLRSPRTPGTGRKLKQLKEMLDQQADHIPVSTPKCMIPGPMRSDLSEQDQMVSSQTPGDKHSSIDFLTAALDDDIDGIVNLYIDDSPETSLEPAQLELPKTFPGHLMVDVDSQNSKDPDSADTPRSKMYKKQVYNTVYNQHKDPDAFF